MLSRKKIRSLQAKTVEYFTKAGIVITEQEREKIEIADFGLNDIENTGLQLLIYINTERYCAKEMVLFSGQTCPEHKHPRRFNGEVGKRETFRCRFGKVYLYVDESIEFQAEKTLIQPPLNGREYYTASQQIILNPGEQYTIEPDTLHWFQAGSAGAVISEFSSNSDDLSDLFTDPRIKRVTEY